MKFDKAAAIAAILAIAVTVALYPKLPARIPIHWGLTGKPDNWGPAYAIFLLPIGALISNLSIMGDEKSDLGSRTRKARLISGLLLAGEALAFW